MLLLYSLDKMIQCDACDACQCAHIKRAVALYYLTSVVGKLFTEYICGSPG